MAWPQTSTAMQRTRKTVSHVPNRHCMRCALITSIKHCTSWWALTCIAFDGANAVAAMLDLRSLVLASRWVLDGWTEDPPPDPCGAADCGTWVGLEDQLAFPDGLPRCGWVQIACRSWRVVSM